MKLLKYMSIGLLTLAFASCGSDYLDREDLRGLDADAAATAAGNNPDVFLNGIWSHLVDMYGTQHDTFNFMATLHACDMGTEDIAMGAEHWFNYDYQVDNRMYNYRRVNVGWTTFYTTISKANEVISLYPEGAKSDGEKALLGQALALRGFSYYYLIQLFRNYMTADGTVNMTQKGLPLILTSVDVPDEAERTKLKGANTVARVFEQIEKDLTEGVKLLEEAKYERPSKNYVDAHVANGLLARYYLMAQKWSEAAAAANKARQGYTPMGNAGLHDGFYDMTNAEWMWGFDHSTETSTVYASFFSMISNLAPGYAGLGYAPRLIDARLYSQIPDDDYRKSLFNGPAGDKSQATAAAQLPYANVKFGNDGNWTMDYMYMRAAEMYLIEAEALVRQGNATQGAQVLGELMKYRQPSWNESTTTVDEILFQRRIELWGEGFRWFDMKRNNLGIDRTYEGNNHLPGDYQLKIPGQDVRWTYQIPRSEMQENDQLTDADQNP